MSVPTFITHKTWLLVRAALVADNVPPSFEAIGLFFDPADADAAADRAAKSDPSRPVVVFEGSRVVKVDRTTVDNLWRFYPEVEVSPAVEVPGMAIADPPAESCADEVQF